MSRPNSCAVKSLTSVHKSPFPRPRDCPHSCGPDCSGRCLRSHSPGCFPHCPVRCSPRNSARYSASCLDGCSLRYSDGRPAGCSVCCDPSYSPGCFPRSPDGSFPGSSESNRLNCPAGRSARWVDKQSARPGSSHLSHTASFLPPSAEPEPIPSIRGQKRKGRGGMPWPAESGKAGKVTGRGHVHRATRECLAEPNRGQVHGAPASKMPGTS